MASKRSGKKAKSGGGAKGAVAQRGKSNVKQGLKDLQVRNARGTAIKGGGVRDASTGMATGQRQY